MQAATDLKQTDNASCHLFCSDQSGRKGNRMRLAISRSTQALCMLWRLKRVAELICPVMFISPNEARTPSPNELIYTDLLTPRLQVLIKLIYPNHFQTMC